MMPLYISVGPDRMRRKCSAVSSADVLPLAPDETLVTLSQYSAEPSGDTHAWKPVALDFELIPVPPAPPADCTCSVLDFKARFTQAERQAIKAAQKRHASDAVRDALDLIAEDMESARDKTLDRRDLRLQAGVQALAMFGLIAPSRVTDIIGADALGA